MHRALTLILTAAILFAAIPAAAADIDQREHIEVVGVAQIKVVPNEFVLHTTLTHFDKTLQTASRQNEKAVAELFKAVQNLGVERKYIVTDTVGVNAVTEGYRQQGNFRHVGYNVSRGVMVILHEANKIEPVMKELFAVGVDYLSLSAGHTDIKDLTENAQIQAASAARHKGKLLSSALGRQLGNAVAISEDAPHFAAAPQNFVYTANTPDLGDSLSLGKITVQSAVRVKFLLK